MYSSFDIVVLTKAGERYCTGGGVTPRNRPFGARESVRQPTLWLEPNLSWNPPILPSYTYDTPSNLAETEVVKYTVQKTLTRQAS